MIEIKKIKLISKLNFINSKVTSNEDEVLALIIYESTPKIRITNASSVIIIKVMYSANSWTEKTFAMTKKITTFAPLPKKFARE